MSFFFKLTDLYRNLMNMQYDSNCMLFLMTKQYSFCRQNILSMISKTGWDFAANRLTTLTCQK